jgi:hypothetical protein
MIKRNTILESVLTGLLLSVALVVLLNIPSHKSNSNHGDRQISAVEVDGGVPDQETPKEVFRESRATPQIPSVISVEVGRELLCLITVIYSDDEVLPIYKPDVPLPLTKFFFTLFRLVISPNAP